MRTVVWAACFWQRRRQRSTSPLTSESKTRNEVGLSAGFAYYIRYRVR
jgi:hypothetical protein